MAIQNRLSFPENLGEHSSACSEAARARWGRFSRRNYAITSSMSDHLIEAKHRMPLQKVLDKLGMKKFMRNGG